MEVRPAEAAHDADVQ
ncbi:hypothetical protein, partial [Frankia sp. AvcI1]